MYYKICSDKTRKLIVNPHFNNILRFYQTHYQVLNLPKHCTTKEIKDAYFALSKAYHPDINKNKQTHKKFLEINEAYKILGKPDSRRSYDLGLSNDTINNPSNSSYREVNTNQTRNPYKDPIFWENRDKAKDDAYRNRSYYGINGIDKVSNHTILFFCILLAIIGVSLQYVLIVNSFTFQREELLKKSIEANRVYREARQMALLNDNDKQIELLRMRLNHDMLYKKSDK